MSGARASAGRRFGTERGRRASLGFSISVSIACCTAPMLSLGSRAGGIADAGRAGIADAGRRPAVLRCGDADETRSRHCFASRASSAFARSACADDER